MKYLSLLLILFWCSSYAKSKAPACTFSKNEKGALVDLKKPKISKDIAEIKLKDGAIAVIKQNKPGLELSISFGEVTTKIITKDPSLNVLQLRSSFVEYELQCAL